MNDTELDALLRAGAPSTTRVLQQPGIDSSATALRDAIVAEPITNAFRTGAEPRATKRHTQRLTGLRRAGPRRTAVALCGIGALALAGGVVRGRMHVGPDQAWSASAVRFAEASPRLLIAGHDYVVSRATQSKGSGEMGFIPTDTKHSSEPSPIGAGFNMTTRAGWQATAFGPDALPARIAAARRLPHVTDLGRIVMGKASQPASGEAPSAHLFHQGGTTRYRALWTQSGATIEYSIDAKTVEDAEQVVAEALVQAPTLVGASSEIQLNWMRPREYAMDLANLERDASIDDLGTTTAAGRSARWFKYRRYNRYRAIWRSDRFALRVDGTAPSRAAFADMLRRLHTVDVDTWLSAMPASVVKPLDQDATIGELLAGVPLPPGGWRANGPSGSGDVQDHYQLGASVYGGVACGWIEEWLLARQAGDTARVRQAAAALDSSHRWKGLIAMSAQGDYPAAIHQYADVINGRIASVPAGGKLQAYVTHVHGTRVRVPAGIGDYAAGLGCTTPTSK